MENETLNVPTLWAALVNDKKCIFVSEFPYGWKYFGKLTVIKKPTEAELKAELTRLKISLPA
jgi:hypothetical protein